MRICSRILYLIPFWMLCFGWSSPGKESGFQSEERIQMLVEMSESWQRGTPLSSSDVHSLDRESIDEALRLDWDWGRGSVTDFWLEPMRSIPEELLPNDLLSELAALGSGIETPRPSISHSAWVLLAERITYSDGEAALYFDTPVNEKGCPVGYLTGLGLLAENGSQTAITKLAERTKFRTEEGLVCAEMATRGLVVSAYRDKDPLALEAVRSFNELYIEFVQSNQ